MSATVWTALCFRPGGYYHQIVPDALARRPRTSCGIFIPWGFGYRVEQDQAEADHRAACPTCYDPAPVLSVSVPPAPRRAGMEPELSGPAVLAAVRDGKVFRASTGGNDYRLDGARPVTVTAVVRSLRGAGWVELAGSVADTGRRFWHLTVAGREALETSEWGTSS